MPQNPFPFGSIDYDNWNYEHPQDAASQADPIADAKVSLEKADALERNRDLPDASTRASVQGLMPQFEGLEKKYGGAPHGLLRGATEPLAEMGGLAGLGSFVPGGGAVVGLPATAAMLPDFIRRAVAPEADESRPGMVETALTAGPALMRGVSPAVQALKNITGKASAALSGGHEAANLLGGRARAFEGAAQPMRPWPQASSVAEEAPAIEQLMESPSFRNLPKGNVSKATPPSLSPFKRMQAAGEFAGDRSNRNIGGLTEELPGGLNDVFAGKIKPNKMPLGKTLEIPTSTPIDPMEKLAARSAERFGRRFRKE